MCSLSADLIGRKQIIMICYWSQQNGKQNRGHFSKFINLYRYKHSPVQVYVDPCHQIIIIERRTVCPFVAYTVCYSSVIIGAMASQITSLAIVYSTVYSATDQRKQQSSASPTFVRAIHRWPVNSPHKWPVTRKLFPFDDVIMCHLEGGIACRQSIAY